MFGLRTLLNPEIARNPALLTAAHALRAALFPIPVITVFWQEQIGMSLADIMWLQAIFAATIVILEFPSGYIADRLGYRLSLCLGAAFWLAGWTIYALGTTMARGGFSDERAGRGKVRYFADASDLLRPSVCRLPRARIKRIGRGRHLLSWIHDRARIAGAVTGERDAKRRASGRSGQRVISECFIVSPRSRCFLAADRCIGG